MPTARIYIVKVTANEPGRRKETWLTLVGSLDAKGAMEAVGKELEAGDYEKSEYGIEGVVGVEEIAEAVGATMALDGFQSLAAARYLSREYGVERAALRRLEGRIWSRITEAVAGKQDEYGNDKGNTATRVRG